MEQNNTQEYNRFAITLSPSTDLGMAMLIVEDEEGHYEPVAIAASIGEAREIAANDMRERTRRLERDQDPGICPCVTSCGRVGAAATIVSQSRSPRSAQ